MQELHGGRSAGPYARLCAVTDEDDLPRGTAIRRFVVLDRIGAGAMGVVYAAFDYTLDRKIALKLVRSDTLREAQALARLSHRNVVAVYDVGTYKDRVYLAMELVDGVTLREWLKGERTIDQIIACVIDAGRGLAAAHAAGLVHGDFKPENVLVDKTGRSVVVDFGLAGPIGGENRGGTPVYMAPEAHDAPATAASDQFSFCVTLFEALYGARPADAKDASVRVPARVRSAIDRGLSASPDARWPSVSELLDTLAPSLHRRNRAILVGAVVAAGALGVGATSMLRGDREPSCDGGTAEVAKVWSQPRRDELRARVSPDTFDRAAKRLDAYTGAWATLHRAACRATHVSRTQSAAVLDLRMECLRRRLLDVDASLVALAGAPDRHDARTLDALLALAPLDGCSDVQALQQPSPLPSDPAKRARAIALGKDYAKAKALYEIGRPKEALAFATALVAATGEVGWRPLEAEALHLLGRLQSDLSALDDAEATLRRGIAAGQAGNTPETLARSWLDLIWLVGEYRQQPAEAEKLGVIARGVIEAAGNPPLYLGALEDRLGIFALARGDLATATTRLEAGLAIREKAFGPNHYELVASLQHVALVRDDPRALLERAVRIAETELGPDHPVTGQVLNSLAGALYSHEQLDEAIALWRRALAIAERTNGPHSAPSAAVRSSLSLGLRAQQQFAEAVTLSEQSVADFIALYTEQHPEAADYVMNLGYALEDAGRLADADTQMTRALGLFEQRHGPAAGELVPPLLALARVRAANPAAAIPLLERALAIRDEHPADDVARIRIALAELLWKTDRPRARRLATAARETAAGPLRARVEALLAK